MFCFLFSVHFSLLKLVLVLSLVLVFVYTDFIKMFKYL